MVNLIILESPFKVNSVKSYLGSSYKVVACKGHVRDLPKSTLGIDIENDFAPQYEEKVSKVSKENRPICLATDGVNLVENVGGVDGFCEFLEDINTEGSKDYEDAMAFARIAGWKGTKPSPKALL